MVKNILGPWFLVKMKLNVVEGKKSENILESSGYIIFTPEGFVSVGISSKVDLAKSSPEEILKANFFYLGRYQINGDVMTTEILSGSHPAMIGQSVTRNLHLEKDLLTVTWTDPFSSGEIIWKKYG